MTPFTQPVLTGVRLLGVQMYWWLTRDMKVYMIVNHMFSNVINNSRNIRDNKYERETKI